MYLVFSVYVCVSVGCANCIIATEYKSMQFIAMRELCFLGKEECVSGWDNWMEAHTHIHKHVICTCRLQCFHICHKQFKLCTPTIKTNGALQNSRKLGHTWKRSSQENMECSHVRTKFGRGEMMIEYSSLFVHKIGFLFKFLFDNRCMSKLVMLVELCACVVSVCV